VLVQRIVKAYEEFEARGERRKRERGV
jgi:hypothetical protein